MITDDLRNKFEGLRPDAIERIERMWAEAEPFMDSDFRKQLPGQFEQRVWELYLAFVLLQQGARITPRAERVREGPDFRIETSSGLLWVEAVAPGNGTTEDAAPALFGEGSGQWCGFLPDGPIELRYASAIAAKVKRHREYVNEKDSNEKDSIVSADDAFVVALSGSRIDLALVEDEEMPRVVKLLFGIGNDAVRFDLSSSEARAVAYGPTPRRVIAKRSGQEVSSRMFFEEKNESLSGVLFSLASANNFPNEPGRELLFAHNPLAVNPLPSGWLGIGREWYLQLEGRHVCRAD
ncbi:MAG: hypothetical protein H6837_01835 [Planctomycetes bacterium]|nr:hypothetical protein [Planctomycetota bacterium]